MLDKTEVRRMIRDELDAEVVAVFAEIKRLETRVEDLEHALEHERNERREADSTLDSHIWSTTGGGN